MSRIELSNKVFGYLTVIKYSMTINRAAYWLCQCVCGSEKIIRGSHLKAKRITSCGCLTNEILSNKNRKYSPHIASARKIFNTNYKDGNLSFEDFMKLTQMPCHYCGHLPSNTYNRFTNSTSVEIVKSNGDFIYNGLDRLNPFEPHNIDNIVTCCSTCNYAKLQMSDLEFKEWILQISAHYIFGLSALELQKAVLLYLERDK